MKRAALGIAIYLCLFAIGFGLAGNADAQETTRFEESGCWQYTTSLA